jgi:hypothetical protein
LGRGEGRDWLFGAGVFLPRSAWTGILLFYTCAGMTDTQIFPIEIGFFFLLRLAWNSDLPDLGFPGNLE